MPPTPEQIAVARAKLTGPPDKWWVRELSNSTPWLPEGCRASWLYDPQSKHMLVVYQDARQKAQAVVRPDGIKLVSGLIAAKYDAIPNPQVTTQQFARQLVLWLGDIRSRILTTEFANRLVDKGQVKDWLKGKINDPKVLISTAAPISMSEPAPGLWKLTFKTITWDGAVESWVAEGTNSGFSIGNLAVNFSAPSGTFSNPEEL